MEAVGDVSPSSDTGFIGAPSIILETGLPVTACTIGVEQKRKRKTEVKGFKQGFSGWPFYRTQVSLVRSLCPDVRPSVCLSVRHLVETKLL